MDPNIYEKMGVFYLGREWDTSKVEPTDKPLLYDSRDLCTHAVCVGMTGSGKTGLGLVTLEEAAMDRIPAIVIDPKGDLGNLLLTFPDLNAGDFFPWVSNEEAARKDMTREAFAEKTATTWKEGLARWGEDGERIRRMREQVDLALYTPGSTAGRPLTLLGSLHAPSEALRADDDLYRDRVSDMVSSLLGLAGIQADPVTSREHILLTTILKSAWDKGNDLSLEAFISQIPNPGIQRVGVFDLESFYPSKDRMALAMQLNNLLASPSFAAWTQGEPLDIDRLLRAPDGRPRISILNIAHLSDDERMFLVTTVIGELISWMRRQRGTDSLRALFYMDEIFGYLPPTAQPPSKRGLMTLLKQARAFGLGLLLCTQNPADIDYKALSNAGTWFIGRLQTPQDRDRLLKGMVSSMDAGDRAMDRTQLSELISNLGQRRFVVQNVHQGFPQLFETRWAMSYMAGPLSRPQIVELSENARLASIEETKTPEVDALQAVAASQITQSSHQAGAALLDGFVAHKPAIAAAFKETFMPVGVANSDNWPLLWRPMILGCGYAHIDRARPQVKADLAMSRISFVQNNPVPLDWRQAQDCPFDAKVLQTTVPQEGIWQIPAPALSDPAWMKKWETALIAYWTSSAGVELVHAPLLKLTSEVGESRSDFQLRVEMAAREQRDAQKDTLVQRFEKRIITLDERIARYGAQAQEKRSDAQSRQLSSLVQVGGALLSGRKRSMTTVMNQQRMATKSKRAAEAADQKQDAAMQQRDLLQDELNTQLDALKTTYERSCREIEIQLISPAKSSVKVEYAGLVWVPYYAHPDGKWIRAWSVD